MELIDQFGGFKRRFVISAELRALPHRLGAVFAGEGNPYFRRAIAGIWLLVAALLAYVAYGAAEAESLTRWRRENAPSSLVWSSALDAYGFAVLNESDRIQRIVRTLPALTADRASAWLSANGDWIAVYPASGVEGNQPIQVFGRIQREFLPAQAVIRAKPIPLTHGRKRASSRRISFSRLRSPWPAAPSADAWQTAGIGWYAFEETLHRLESLKPLTEPQPAPGARRRAATALDPRSINY